MGSDFSIKIGMTEKEVLYMAKEAGLAKEAIKKIENFMNSDKSDKKISNDVEKMALMALFNRNVPYSTSTGRQPINPKKGHYQIHLPSGSFVNANLYHKGSNIIHRNNDGSYSQLRDSNGDGKVDTYVEVDANNKQTRQIDYNS